jgi:D-beta-D-heptose 7-phosphate kinase / D-beta-D-heptose 1-phosphate adenosyltransferase
VNETPTALATAFPDLKVTVFGDAMLDVYLRGDSERLSREAPVPVVGVGHRHVAPGGAANTAANLSALGAHTAFFSVTGDDEPGVELRAALEDGDVDASGVVSSSDRRTLTKQRVVSGGQLLVRIDEGSTGEVDESLEDALIDRLRTAFAASDAVVISDYGYGILTPRVRAALCDLQRRSPRVLVVDAKDLRAYRDCGVTAVKPNYKQLVDLGGPAFAVGHELRAHAVERCAADLLDATGAQIAAVTLDVDGAVVIERGKPPYRTYARPVGHARAAGAGDTFIAGFTLALAAGAHTPAAAELASAAAAVVVGKEGTATCSPAELASYLEAGDVFVADRAALAQRVDFYKGQGLRVVFTNGCFDILHRGHITYLNRAKALGDVLVVGLNSDESVRRLKGRARPINSLEDRAEVLAALSCIDHIVPFEEDTPSDLIALLRPDVFVKGGDYSRDRLPEADVVVSYGGKVEILPYVKDRSTTGIIAKVQAARQAARS